MSLVAKVQQIESRQQSLEHAMGDLMKVVAGTHDVVSLILNEQRDTRKIVDALAVRVYEHDKRFDKMDQRFESGKGWSFSSPPHSTRHAGPHRAVHRGW